MRLYFPILFVLDGQISFVFFGLVFFFLIGSIYLALFCCNLASSLFVLKEPLKKHFNHYHLVVLLNPFLQTSWVVTVVHQF